MVEKKRKVKQKPAVDSDPKKTQKRAELTMMLYALSCQLPGKMSEFESLRMELEAL